LTRTFWYSPEVKYLVKSTWQKSNPSLRFDPIGGDSQSNHQLIRYTRGAPRPPAPVASTR
jgi:hypothetical protein